MIVVYGRRPAASPRAARRGVGEVEGRRRAEDHHPQRGWGGRAAGDEQGRADREVESRA